MTKTQNWQSERAISIPLGEEKVLTLRVSELKEGKRIGMLNVEPENQDGKRVEFANIVALDSKEHKHVFRILAGALGERVASTIWGVPVDPEDDEGEGKKRFWDTIIKLIKRGRDHSDDESHSREMMGNVLTLPTILGRQLCFELKDKVLKVVLEQVDSEGKVVKSGVVASAGWEQHKMVKKELPSLLSDLLTPGIDAVWKWSSKFPKEGVHEDSWGPTEYWDDAWSPSCWNPSPLADCP